MEVRIRIREGVNGMSFDDIIDSVFDGFGRSMVFDIETYDADGDMLDWASCHIGAPVKVANTVEV